MTTVTVDGKRYEARVADIDPVVLAKTQVAHYWHLIGPRGGDYDLIQYTLGDYRFLAARTKSTIIERPSVEWHE